jgi:flagellar protein FliO/FliZ
MAHNDLPEILRMFAALSFVLGLMGGLIYILRRMGFSGSTARSKRLKVIETLSLDGKRKLAIIQRDARQHLIILGTNSETLIESGFESEQDAMDVSASSKSGKIAPTI